MKLTCEIYIMKLGIWYQKNVFFVLGDKLPTYYDAAISIYIVATKPKSKKMVSTSNL